MWSSRYPYHRVRDFLNSLFSQTKWTFLIMGASVSLSRRGSAVWHCTDDIEANEELTFVRKVRSVTQLALICAQDLQCLVESILPPPFLTQYLYGAPGKLLQRIKADSLAPKTKIYAAMSAEAEKIYCRARYRIYPILDSLRSWAAETPAVVRSERVKI